MVKIFKALFILCVLLCATETYARVEMGSWQSFFNYNNVSQIAQSKEKVYALSDGNLFSVDKTYESIETYTKLSGLSDGNISHIAYCDNQESLVIAYDNCNIDLLSGYNVVNVPDLKNSEVGSKKIYNITIQGKYAYFACGFGIMVVDVSKGEVTDTYIIGNKGEYLTVTNLVFCHDSIYAKTTNGIRRASQKEKNLADFTKWDPIEIPRTVAASDIRSFDNQLLLIGKQAIYRMDTAIVPVVAVEGANQILTDEERIIVCYQDSLALFDKAFKHSATLPIVNATCVINDPQGKGFWANNHQTDGQTLLHLYDKEGQHQNRYIPTGPYSTIAAFVKFQGGKLITGSGGPFDLAMNTPGVVQFFEDNNWSILTEMGMDTAIIHDRHFVDVLDVIVDPNDPQHLFAASWQGLFEFQGYQLVNHYTDLNSPLTPYWIMVILDGLTYDKNGNLWMANMFSQNPIVIYTADKKWETLQYPELQDQETIKEVFLDSKGYMWVLLPRKNPGIFCANLNNTPFNERDDKTKFITNLKDKDGHVITPMTFRCIAEANDGTIWIGTDKGPFLISDPSKVFNSDFIIDRIKITREDNANYADYLLENEQINAIVIDGNNRKWIGTNSSGLYLLSPDGKETIQHFTTENSPFNSNAILDLAINNETGELYVATANALFLYQSDATQGKETYKDVYVYPNPVRETFEGDITINGLLENSLVRISDAEGRIIHQGRSNGGTYIWDGKNLNGRRVDTGVYYIYATQDDGSAKMVTKVAFIR